MLDGGSNPHPANTSRINNQHNRLGEEGGGGRILTPKMLNATNSRSLRELLSNETSIHISPCESTLRPSTGMFRSDHSTTYFTTVTGRIIPTNSSPTPTWMMHQSQLPNICPTHLQQHSIDQPNTALFHHLSTSSPSHPTDTRKENAGLYPASAPVPSPALVDESNGYYSNPTSSTQQQRRRVTLPAHGRTPDLPFSAATTNRGSGGGGDGEITLAGQYQGCRERRRTVTSTTYVRPPDPGSSSSRFTSKQYYCNRVVDDDDNVKVNPGNRRQKEKKPRSPPPVKGKAPDPPSTPYHEVVKMMNNVQARSSPMTSFRRCVSLPACATTPKPQADSIPSDKVGAEDDTLMSPKSSSCSTSNSSSRRQIRRHSLPIISETEDDQTLCTTFTNSSQMSGRRILRTMMTKDYGSSHRSDTSSHSSQNEKLSQYQVGETLRDDSHSIAFTSSAQAWILLTKLPVNSPIFVKRTSREWTYATLISWIGDEHKYQEGEDTEGHAVNGEDSRCTLVASLHSTRNAKKVLKRDHWKKCIRLVNAKAVDGLDTATASPTSVAASNNNLSLETTYLSKTTPKEAIMISRSPSPNTIGSTRSSMSDLYSATNTVTSIMSSADTVADNPYVVRNLFPADSADGSAPEKCNTTRSPTMTTSLNNLHSKKVSWRLTQSVDNLDDNVSSNSDATPLRSGAIAISSSPGSDDNTSSHTSSDSPDFVNLHARHFWGSRRDRMRPSGMQHRTKPSSSNSLCDEKEVSQRMWCDSTCAPESGSVSDASGGSLWNALLDNNSRKEDIIPTLPSLSSARSCGAFD